MLPKLEAEEAMSMADQVAFGTGACKPTQAREIAAGWRKHAAIATRPRRAQPATALPQMGIGVRQVKKKTHGE